MAFVTAPIRAKPRSSFHGKQARCSRRSARASTRTRIMRMTLAETSGTSTRALEIFMPALSSTMESGKIVQWLKQPGEYIKKGEAVMVVESDKADMDVESFEDGYLALVLVNEGETCNVGETVALMAATEDEIESVKECQLACIVSGSGSRHDGTTAVDTPSPPPPREEMTTNTTSTANPSATVASSSVEKPAVRELFMPALSSTMTEGKVVDWLKSEGDEVKKGEMVMVVESDKADMDVESFEDGYLAHIIVQAGDSIGVSETVGYLATTEADIPKVKAWALSQSDTSKLAASNGVAVDSPPTPEAAAPAVAAAAATPAPTTSTPAPIINEGRIVASPYAKVVAKELGVDLRTVRGSGVDGYIHERDVRAASAAAASTAPATPYKSKKLIATPEAKKIAKKENIKLESVTGTGTFGRITEDDVLRAAGKAPTSAAETKKTVTSTDATPPQEQRSTPAEMPAGAKAMNAMQKAVVKNMNASLSVPAFRVEYTIDTDAFDELYAKVKTKGVSVSALLAKAVAMTLEKHPLLNAAYAPDAIEFRPNINIGMAVSLSDGGLITPVLKKANETDIYSLARSWRDLVKRAVGKKLKPDEYNSGTFFISNMGMFGVESFDAILPPGAPAIMAVAASKPVVAMLDNGLVGVKKQMKVNLTADHRHIYGANVAEFLRDLAHLIEKEPMNLML